MRKLQDLSLRSAARVAPIELLGRLDARHPRQSHQGGAPAFILTKNLALEDLPGNRQSSPRTWPFAVRSRATRSPGVRVQPLAELANPCILVRHSTLLSSSSYTDSGCCRLSTGIATCRATADGDLRA